MVNPRSDLCRSKAAMADLDLNATLTLFLLSSYCSYLALTWVPLRFIEIATDCNSVPGAWIEIDCWLALVLTPSVAEMMPDTRRLRALPRALPSMLPPTPRVGSDQVPDTVPLLWVAVLCSSKL